MEARSFALLTFTLSGFRAHFFGIPMHTADQLKHPALWTEGKLSFWNFFQQTAIVELDGPQPFQYPTSILCCFSREPRIQGFSRHGRIIYFIRQFEQVQKKKHFNANVMQISRVVIVVLSFQGSCLFRLILACWGFVCSSSFSCFWGGLNKQLSSGMIAHDFRRSDSIQVCWSPAQGLIQTDGLLYILLNRICQLT